MKTITLAIVTLVAGCAGVSNAYAGTGNVQLGLSTFETRCELDGGALDGDNKNLACNFGDLVVSCEFAAAYANCDWNGGQMNRKVARLIGYVVPQSIADQQGLQSQAAEPKWDSYTD